MQWPSLRLKICPTLVAKTQADRGHLITKLKACGRCSSWMQEATRCPLRAISCRECGGSHLKDLHGCPNIFMSVVLPQGSGQGSHKAHQVHQDEDRGANTLSACFTQHQALLGHQRVEVQARRGTARKTLLADEGSMINLIRRDTATALDLRNGTPW